MVCEKNYKDKPIVSCNGCPNVKKITITPVHKEIYCSNCPNLVKINFINPRQTDFYDEEIIPKIEIINFELKNLICKNCPKLKDIRFLEDYCITANNLEILDCSGCTVLNDINIFGNNLKQFISNSCRNITKILTSANIIECKKCSSLRTITIVSLHNQDPNRTIKIDLRKCSNFEYLFSSVYSEQTIQNLNNSYRLSPDLTVNDEIFLTNLPNNINITKDIVGEFVVDETVINDKGFGSYFLEKQNEIICYSIQKYKKELSIEWKPDITTLRKFSFEEVNKNEKVKKLFYDLYKEKLAIVFGYNYISTNPQAILDFEFLFCNLNEETFLNIKNHIQKGNIFLQKAEDMTKEKLIN